MRKTTYPTKAREKTNARTLAPSSYEAERVILSVEYNRTNNRATARTEVVALIATLECARVTGLTKSGLTPGGGFVDGIISGLRPGGNEETILSD